MMLDRDVTEAMIRAHSLLLLGGPRDNEVSRWLAGQMPMRVDAAAVTIMGRRFAAPDSVGQLIRPNPLNPTRYVLTVDAAPPAAMARWDADRLWRFAYGSPAQPFDWAVGAVTGGPALREGLDPSRNRVAAGVFDAGWRLDPRWPYRGAVSSALNPGGTGADGLHVETISTYPEDYRAAHLILTRGLWRSGPVRRRLILSHYVRLLGWSAAAGAMVAAYYIAEGMIRGVRFGATMRWLAGMLPEFLAIILVIPALFVGARCAFLAWHQRRVRRQREAAVAGGYEMVLAWNGERFGVVIDGRLHAEPIADLLAWQETDAHLFVVMREAEVLFPIRLADTDPAALLPLRQALAAAALPDLWTYAERDLLRRLTAPPEA